jgi:hypothetical protein
MYVEAREYMAVELFLFRKFSAQCSVSLLITSLAAKYPAATNIKTLRRFLAASIYLAFYQITGHNADSRPRSWWHSRHCGFHDHRKVPNIQAVSI